ncbi:MAG TPA: c-type cytochrome [Xanthobacteraceae bacterium]|nr:c-type cytochrome [Xanthobacteraceae bacterium]
MTDRPSRLRCLLPALIALAIGLVGCSKNDSEKGQAEKQPAVDIAVGKSIAERQCSRCHGLDGRGTGPAIPTLAGQPEAFLLAAIAEYKDGRRNHAALRSIVEGLSDADTRNVAAYFASLPPIDAASRQYVQLFSPYETGKKLAGACGQCHGPDGNTKTPGTPSLAGQQPRYFITAVHEYLNGTRATSPMHMLVRDMRAVDVDSLAQYFASQTPAQRPPADFGNPAAGERHTVLCTGCHGLHGVSDDPATPNLAGQDPQYLVAATKAFRNARKYEPMIRVVAGLTDADVDDIAAYYTIQKSKPAENGPGLIQDLTQRCNRCHGPGVRSTDVAIPRLRGQDMDYLVMALRSYRDNRRQTSVMHSMVLPYGDAVIEGLASYYASQPAK